MPKFEIGVKDLVTNNIYYTGYSIPARNSEEATDKYLQQSMNTHINRKLIYANKV